MIGIKQVYTHIIEDKKSKSIEFDINERISKFLLVLENLRTNPMFEEEEQKLAEVYLEKLKNRKKRTVNYLKEKIIDIYKDDEEYRFVEKRKNSSSSSSSSSLRKKSSSTTLKKTNSTTAKRNSSSTSSLKKKSSSTTLKKKASQTNLLNTSVKIGKFYFFFFSNLFFLIYIN